MTGARPVKRSLTLRGHRTSVSLEDEFWQAFREIAEEKSMALNVLAAEIDAGRGIETGLATAIRLYVLAYYRDRALLNG
ncbi:Ribbon-helix-helix domain protein [Roseovarius sp. EC-HK134]|uniref:ribbon-helix-helix domain-containing protein n=1 Tax=Roseovarius TaxID=74030 RepID=UPI0012541280|nr:MULTISPECIES: ribbon-helix-helix domain-containing protein [Roseovarius]MBW4975684.1 ribbon-helix-helix domain-containing protein [Roseovarius mucosus]VVT29361.1 Ribbon-helix-helix domain protein [Roseovarius sp. EC-SD190]VVT30400.1 Ribbon-helix-helix domain protein [Roseovarius sp. EC-HK134]